MTISYNLDVSSSSAISFLRIIFRWRGSIWKSVCVELAFWCCCYFGISVVYRFILTLEHQITFARIAGHIDEKLDYINLTFLLGFFVAIVVDRWKHLSQNIGFIDRPALQVNNYIVGQDSTSRLYRRTVLRYICVAQVLVLRDVSTRVKKRFPSIQSLVDAGLLLKHEQQALEDCEGEFPVHWVPLQWACQLTVKARADLRILADAYMNNIFNEICAFQGHLRTILTCDWIGIPLAYTQVVFLAVRVYFLLCLVSRQFIINDVPNKAKIDLVVPFMSICQFVFQMGWLKVAEALLNPNGDDDDDLELNYIIDRNIATAMSMSDQVCKTPEMIPDQIGAADVQMYSEDTAHNVRALVGSTANLLVDTDVKMVPRSSYENTDERHTRLKFFHRSNSLHLGGIRDSFKRSIKLFRSQSMSAESGYHNHVLAKCPELKEGSNAITPVETTPKEKQAVHFDQLPTINEF